MEKWRCYRRRPQLLAGRRPARPHAGAALAFLPLLAERRCAFGSSACSMRALRHAKRASLFRKYHRSNTPSLACSITDVAPASSSDEVSVVSSLDDLELSTSSPSFPVLSFALCRSSARFSRRFFRLGHKIWRGEEQTAVSH